MMRRWWRASVGLLGLGMTLSACAPVSPPPSGSCLTRIAGRQADNTCFENVNLTDYRFRLMCHGPARMISQGAHRHVKTAMLHSCPAGAYAVCLMPISAGERMRVYYYEPMSQSRDYTACTAAGGQWQSPPPQPGEKP